MTSGARRGDSTGVVAASAPMALDAGLASSASAAAGADRASARVPGRIQRRQLGQGDDDSDTRRFRRFLLGLDSGSGSDPAPVSVVGSGHGLTRMARPRRCSQRERRHR